jgi:glucokinase
MTVLGVDIGGTKIAVGLVRLDGTVLATAATPTPATEGAAAVIAAVRDVSAALLAQSQETVIGCGVGSAGVIDPSTGAVSSATSSLRGWAGTELRAELESALGLPVTVLNDVHAHAVAEARYGAGADQSSMLLVALGTGIGGAFVRDGRVELGRHGSAGHFGHVPVALATGVPCTCGRRGHLEAVASGPAILSRYLAAPGADATVADTRGVFRRAAAGDQHAISVTDSAAVAIGEAIGGFLNTFDPATVVVGGGLAFADDGWFERIVAVAHESAIPAAAECPVIRSAHASDSAILGAATWFLEQKGHAP